MPFNRGYVFLSLAGLALTFPGHANETQSFSAQGLADRPTLNSYGLPGLIDMPTANVLPDGELGLAVSSSAVGNRGTLSFQVLPNVTATFRYAGIDLTRAGMRDLYFDRSFDVHWQALDEDTFGWSPAVAIGIRDIAGTGLYGGEYIVATRHFGARDRVAVTAGLGWGRLGERDGFSNPLGAIDDRFDTRPGRSVGTGGTVNFDQFFRGDAAVFGGIEWQATDRLRLQLEYSSDTYSIEAADGLIDASSPFNFGATYQITDGIRGGAYVLGGDTIGVSLSMTLNPTRPPVPPSSGDAAPRPVAVRAPQAMPYDTDWVSQPGGAEVLRDNFALLFEDQGLHLENLTMDARRATIRVRNTQFNHSSQALGRVLRAMSAALPPSVEVFEVIFVVEGLDTTRVRVARTDLEMLEFDPGGAELAMAVAEVEDARAMADPVGLEVTTPSSRFTWGIGPYLEASVFDPDNPILVNAGVEAQAEYRFGSGFVAEGAVRAALGGNLDDSQIVNAAVILPDPPPVVRSNAALYRQQSDFYVERLTLAHFGRPAENLYSRVSFGYLERMYAGVSGELLWQPAHSRLGLGIEVNHVWARDFDGGFGLRDYNVTSGHVSAYYRLTEDFDVQIDAGRYLAGDWGATLSIDRTFNNGWRVGAYATFTDVPFESFGEGSFDKGIEIEIPLAWFLGTSNRRTSDVLIQPVLRDGGARVQVEGRLHDLVIDYTRPRLEDTEAMIWR
ncbi:YjbH domain-containing protein [Rhodobacteraceae bacterium N5(2021)]|uniref:YjbH domain-containing protein n=1 Tax=Gymnodinialimonas phycosphaerae TaxID=2841589 RepID=A0A975TR96_9RHOB|nr:YjbH domain-containing protein [Gymnodinialimonas phycosphaerae]MBY4893383.1 YjbH domain-containing protein [Gymnodinialimonas phycosphaerae]